MGHAFVIARRACRRTASLSHSKHHSMGSSLPLILVPTPTESRLITPLLSAAGRDDLQVACCGFGPIAAAASTAHLLAQHEPASVLLVGIAGGFPGQGELGQAYRFGKTVSYGVGVGTAAAFQSAASLGWPQTAAWKNETSAENTDDVIGLLTAAGAPEAERLLLTACSASADQADAAVRQQLWPDAFAEDMEGFAVALACQQRGTPCMIIRGLSNWVGDREKRNWLIEEALQAAAALVLESVAAR